MRVFAPRRIVRCTSISYGGIRSVLGFPVLGEWRDVPDYFVQVTSGLPENDVTHAKLVDSCELPYTVFNGKVAGENYTQSAAGWGSSYPVFSGQGFVNYASYKTQEVTAFLGPSPNYKGKHPKKKESVIRIRDLRPFSFHIPSIAWSRSGVLNRIYVYLYMPEDPHQGAGSTVKTHYMALSISPTYGTVELRGKILDDIPAPKYPTVPNPHPYGYITKDEAVKMAQRCLKITTEWISENYDVLHDHGPEGYTYTYFVYDCEVVDFPSYQPRSGYALCEDYFVGERLEPLLAGVQGNIASYWTRYLTEHALLSACESLPRLNDNSIQNLLEVAGFIKAVVVDRKIEMPKSLADAWLAYRYTYCTGKADIEEAIKFVYRRIDLGTLDRSLVGYGSSSIEWSDGTHISCRCKLEVTPKNLGLFKKLWRALDVYGLTPDFYVIWDSIPYSFMVDWFLPIGTIASVEDVNAMYFSGEYYTLSDPIYSLSYTREVDQLKIHCYTRWRGSVPSSLHSRYWFEPPSASSVTVGKRVLDAASIFIGH